MPNSHHIVNTNIFVGFQQLNLYPQWNQFYQVDRILYPLMMSDHNWFTSNEFEKADLDYLKEYKKVWSIHKAFTKKMCHSNCSQLKCLSVLS